MLDKRTFQRKSFDRYDDLFTQTKDRLAAPWKYRFFRLVAVAFDDCLIAIDIPYLAKNRLAMWISRSNTNLISVPAVSDIDF